MHTAFGPMLIYLIKFLFKLKTTCQIIADS